MLRAVLFATVMTLSLFGFAQGATAQVCGPGLDPNYVHDVSTGTQWTDPETGNNVFTPVFHVGGTFWRGVLTWDGFCESGSVTDCIQNIQACVD